MEIESKSKRGRTRRRNDGWAGWEGRGGRREKGKTRTGQLFSDVNEITRELTRTGCGLNGRRNRSRLSYSRSSRAVPPFSSLLLSLSLSRPLFSQPSPAFIASIISRIRPAAIQLRILLRDISREFRVNCETTCILMHGK